MMAQEEMFKNVGFNLIVSGGNGNKISHQATVNLEIKVDSEQTSRKYAGAEGVGPIDALAKALVSALEENFPKARQWRLSGFSVSATKPSEGTASPVEVVIKATNGISEWESRAVSQDLIEASWRALTASIKQAMLK